uniref:DNA topoisomerase n=1 Tax=Bos indicus x Bos taurus TaxID=30522 RepID=A0A4W2F5C8_BOBOX
MKCSLGISNFLEEISSLSHSVVFLYFFALITEEGPAPCIRVSSHVCREALNVSLAAEEVATFYGKKLDREYTKEVFQNNFFSDWRKEMTAEEGRVIKHLDRCDFTEIHRLCGQDCFPEGRHGVLLMQKLKEEEEKLQQEFGCSILDGHREKIGSRGDHPKMERLKRRVLPEDVVINCSRCPDSTVPEPPAGPQWKEVGCDCTVMWLAAWTENVQNFIKYVTLNPGCKLKVDWGKYEAAWRLKGAVGKICSQYRTAGTSPEMRTRQRAVALYFINKTGNGEEGGGLGGCCSLRVEHLQLYPEASGSPDVVEFDFLGKDSIRSYNRVLVEKLVMYRNLQLLSPRKPRAEPHPPRHLQTASLNRHLQDPTDGLTARVFRTYNTSVMLQGQLQALPRGQRLVAAKLLVGVPESRSRGAHPGDGGGPWGTASPPPTLGLPGPEQSGAMPARGPAPPASASSLEKRGRLLEKLEEQLLRVSTQATDKEGSKQVALGTSELICLDPRIGVTWCKSEVPVEKVYKTQREKLTWALDMVGEDFEF